MSPAAWNRLLLGVAACAWGVALIAGTDAPRPTSAAVLGGDLDGEVQVTEDPERFGAAVRLVVRRDGIEMEAWARGDEGRALEERQVGEWVELEGSVRPMDAEWRLRAGVVGRVEVDAVRGWRHGGPVSRAANGVRRTLADGAGAMDDHDAALFLGLVLGDRRGHDEVTEDAFAGSGLTHVLAVSGSNVAFILVLAGPVLRRLRFGGRLAATLAVVAFFAVVTRLEPSVLRAATMTGLGACAVTFGWEAESRRVLAVTVAILLCVDPSLARSLGFQLSVAASLGIVSFARPLAVRLPGPRWLAEPVSVTAVAQLAVAPLLLPVAGGLPVASLPANLLAVPATGPVMVWGVPAGMVAGLAGGDSTLASLLHLPTSWMVSWIDAVARAGAAAPLGELGARHLVLLGAALAGVVWGRRVGHRALAGAVACAVLVQPAVAIASGAGVGGDLGPGAVLHRSGRAVVVVIDSDARVDLVLEGLRRSAVTRIDVLVAVDGGRGSAEVAAAIGRRASPRLVLAPEGHRVPGASTPPAGVVITVGELRVRVGATSPQLDVSVEPITRERDPPGRCASACAPAAAGPPP